MFATVTLLTLVSSVSGTPYVSGGDSPRGTDCSGLVSWVTNAATGRPIYGDRFNTGNIERALLARGFKYGSEPGALNVGWNGGHTAATLPDGTPVSSGEGGGVRIGGGGAFQKQFGHHMFLPMPVDEPIAPDAPDAPEAPVVMMAGEVPMAPPPAPDPFMAPPPAPEPPMAPPPAPEPLMAPPPPPEDPFAPPPPPEDPFAPPAPADIAAPA
jgi:NlpC/P60 family